ncbi:SgrR family transcriptional regulator [Paenibacillus sonchi]|uniref:SgrR family transcriptional regulator n=1 Tax=Paenibacillus sonchi TaxID=373687 RepID=A0A974SC84_9BACL|nr:ABC transporter substrate-binding protein [Paenibacillus sonchi]QQZ59951.1 SgrR family transcriptional regulator [Paenibacillus sonchi]
MDNNIVHFLRLASALNPLSRLQEPIPVTIELLASVLCCTPRNVKFILRKLEDKGCIEWQPGRGRGHKSGMAFMRSVEEVLEEHLQELTGKGKIKQGIELIGLPEVNGPLQERLLSLLNMHMGYHSETESITGLDTLRIIRNRRMEKLDPASVYRAFESYLIEQICSTLVIYDAKNNSFLPGLAHMWEANPEHTSYIFYLRKRVRFHHGRFLTSKDVKETLLRLTDGQSPVSWHYRDIVSVELQGDHRIRIDLARPNLFFLHLFSCVHMSIVPYDVDFLHQPIGTGPYRLLDYNEKVLVLAAFDDYYAIRPLLDRVEIWYVPELGYNDRTYQLPDTEPGGTGAGEGECANLSIDYPALGCRYIMMNFRRNGRQHHPLFRQVLRMLYHPEALVRELGGNRITPADSFLPWISRRTLWNRPSFEAAEKLLRSSGYQGEEITLAYASRREEEREEAEWLQQRGARIGLNLRLAPYYNFNMGELFRQADLLLAEEVLEDDWQWGMINYFMNRSNHFYSLLQQSQRDEIEAQLQDFAGVPEAAGILLLERAESLIRDNCWVLYGSHLNKRAQLNQSLFGLHTGSFGFLDISRLWIKTGFAETAQGGSIGTGTGTGRSNSDSVE